MIDKELWKKSIASISPEHVPEWPCPNCADGKLVLEQQSLCLRPVNKQYSRDEFQKEDFENGILLGILVDLGKAFIQQLVKQARFNAFLRCEACSEVVSVCGRAEILRSQNQSLNKESVFMIPEFFSPPLPIFPLEKEYPKDIKRELAKSFSVFFADSSSAGNKLRTCIEILLDNQQVQKSNNLHSRIQEFRKMNNDLGEMLLAIKWLGNEASHATELDKNDLITAYEIIEYVLEKIFVIDTKHSRLKQLSSDIENRYKPNKP